MRHLLIDFLIHFINFQAALFEVRKYVKDFRNFIKDYLTRLAVAAIKVAGRCLFLALIQGFSVIF